MNNSIIIECPYCDNPQFDIELKYNSQEDYTCEDCGKEFYYEVDYTSYIYTKEVMEAMRDDRKLDQSVDG